MKTRLKLASQSQERKELRAVERSLFLKQYERAARQSSHPSARAFEKMRKTRSKSFFTSRKASRDELLGHHSCLYKSKSWKRRNIGEDYFYIITHIRRRAFGLTVPAHPARNDKMRIYSLRAEART